MSPEYAVTRSAAPQGLHRETSASMHERRRIQRTRTNRDARILLDQGTAAILCTVCDLTNLGAGLLVAHSSGLPQVFDLTFGSVHSRRQCRVVWRVGPRIGVSFE